MLLIPSHRHALSQLGKTRSIPSIPARRRWRHHLLRSWRLLREAHPSRSRTRHGQSRGLALAFARSHHPWTYGPASRSAHGPAGPSESAFHWKRTRKGRIRSQQRRGSRRGAAASRLGARARLVGARAELVYCGRRFTWRICRGAHKAGRLSLRRSPASSGSESRASGHRARRAAPPRPGSRVRRPRRAPRTSHGSSDRTTPRCRPVRRAN